MPEQVHHIDFSDVPALVKLADPDDIWAGYDPERVKQGLTASAGAFRDLDRDAFLADLKEQGQQDSSGRPIGQ